MKALDMLSFSDSHLGRNGLDQELMVAHLRKMIFPLLKKVQFVNIGGDLFDEALGFGDVSVLCILAFITEFLKLCDENDVTVRVLKGTHLHDRTQLKTIPTLHQSNGLKNDLRYFDKVSLEYIERFDMRVLYIPDNTPQKTSDDVMRDVADLMAKAGWDYVDYVFIHAYFQHVVPDNVEMKCKVFRVDQFEFVKRAVMIGHVHTHHTNGMFIYHGSTDRTHQGEEEAKGCILVHDGGDDKPVRFRFIENKEAFVFRTYRVSHFTEVSNIVDEIEQKFKNEDLNKPLYVRIEHPDAILRTAAVKELKRKYPEVVYSHRNPDKKNKNNVRDSKELIESLTLSSAPTPQNLPEAVIAHLASVGMTTTLTESRVRTMLEQTRAAK